MCSGILKAPIALCIRRPKEFGISSNELALDDVAEASMFVFEV
jgi:hypothetical protein